MWTTTKKKGYRNAEKGQKRRTENYPTKEISCHERDEDENAASIFTLLIKSFSTNAKKVSFFSSIALFFLNFRPWGALNKTFWRPLHPRAPRPKRQIQEDFPTFALTIRELMESELSPV